MTRKTRLPSASFPGDQYANGRAAESQLKPPKKSPLWGFLRAQRITSRYFSNRRNGHWDNAGIERRSGISARPLLSVIWEMILACTLCNQDARSWFFLRNFEREQESAGNAQVFWNDWGFAS